MSPPMARLWLTLYWYLQVEPLAIHNELLSVRYGIIGGRHLVQPYDDLVMVMT